MKQTLLTLSPMLMFCIALASLAAAQQPNTVKLPSGKIVKVLAVVPIHFNSGAPPALMLKYETDLKVSDVPSVRKEVDEIWSSFRADVENGHFTAAIISANEKPSGLLLKTSNGFNFVFEKRTDGQWHCLQDDKK